MKALHGVVLTLAGIGLLSGSGGAQGARLHDQVRGRVLGSLGEPAQCSPADVRAALRDDPEFDRLLDYLRTRARTAVDRHSSGDDAVQQTLLKIWRGRPEVFLLPHDEIVRYLRSANGRNLLTEIDRSDARRRTGPLEVEPADRKDATLDVDTEDLLEALESRLGVKDRSVLAARLDGLHSERKVASATGLTRHAVGQADRRIAAALSDLL